MILTFHITIWTVLPILFLLWCYITPDFLSERGVDGYSLWIMAPYMLRKIGWIWLAVYIFCVLFKLR